MLHVNLLQGRGERVGTLNDLRRQTLKRGKAPHPPPPAVSEALETGILSCLSHTHTHTDGAGTGEERDREGERGGGE